MGRRSFLRVSLFSGAALGVGATAWWWTEQADGGDAARAVRRSVATSSPLPPTTTVPPPPDIHAEWLIEENSRPGSTTSGIGDLGTPHAMEGFFDTTSAALGDVVRLYVSTTAPEWHVEAYRMGWYQGLGARLAWTSPTQSGIVQPAPSIDASTNTVTANWTQPLQFPISGEFIEGCYLFKLVSSAGPARFVPLTIRDDENPAAYLLVNAVSTWQAYNQWGGYSLYVGNDQSFRRRARVVSFDRPYEDNGAAQFLAVELPLVQLVERLGLDVTYATSVDVHRHPERLLTHKAILSPGHDEYWSLPMRNGLEAARDHGVNLAFFGANAAYRQVRFDASNLGPERRQVCYKSAAEDPLARAFPGLATVNWREPPVTRPESQLLGEQYECNPVSAPMVVTNPDHWIFAGTGLTQGQQLPGVVGGEYDHYIPSSGTTANVTVLTHSPLICGGRSSYADMTYYTAPSGAGVWDVGTQAWVPLLSGAHALPAAVTITTNLLDTFGRGPAALTHPPSPA